MAAGFYIQRIAVVNLRAAVFILCCQVSKPCQYVNFCNYAGVGLDGLHPLLDIGHQGGVNTALDGINSLFCPKDGLFVLLQFRGNVTLGRHQRLLADPLRRNLVLIGVSNLEVIAEYVVEAYS